MTGTLLRVKNLMWDMLIFAEMLLYWPFAIVIMLPIRRFDRRFNTNIFPSLDRLMRAIADL
jgi:hypothetical protein